MLPKAVNHSHANERYIEEQHGTDMREAGIESLESLFPGVRGEIDQSGIVRKLQHLEVLGT